MAALLMTLLLGLAVWRCPAATADPIARWRTVAVGGGGFVTGALAHPDAPYHVYIRTDVGGLYRWDGGTDSWVPLLEWVPRLKGSFGGEAFAIHPTRAATLYAALGKYTWEDLGGAIMRSDDAGATWTTLLDSSVAKVGMGSNEDLRWCGERLAVNSAAPPVILFGSRKDGMWRSPDDGASWAQVSSLPRGTSGLGIVSVTFSDVDPAVAFASVYGSGVYRSSDAGATWSQLAGAKLSPKVSCRTALGSDGALYVTTRRSPGVLKLQQASTVAAASARFVDVTPRSGVSAAGAPFCGIDVISPAPGGADGSEVVGVATCELDWGSQLFISSDGAASWTEQKLNPVAKDAPWWDDYMLGGPWASSVAFSHAPGENAVWMTNWFGAIRGSIAGAGPAFVQQVKRLEEVVVFDLKQVPSAGGGLLLSAVADVGGFAHVNGYDAAPQQLCAEGSGCAYLQETQSLAYCAANPRIVARVGHTYYTRPSTSGLSTSADGGVTWTMVRTWRNTVVAASTFRGAPYRVAINSGDCSNVVLLMARGAKSLVSFNGGITVAAVKGLPLEPRERFQRDQPLVADLGASATFYYFRGATGQLYASKNSGRTFLPTKTVLPATHSKYTLVAVRARPSVAGEVWIAQQWAGLWRVVDAGTPQEQSMAIPGVSDAVTLTFGAPWATGEPHAAYFMGTFAGQDGTWVSRDLGGTWAPFATNGVTVGNDPIVMEASLDEPGRVFVGTNGRGIYQAL